MVVNLVCTNSGTEQEAKDIYQEAVIAFYESVQQPDFTLRCKISTYLYAISRRLWLKRLAEKKRYTGNVEAYESFVGIDEVMVTIEEQESAFQRMKHALNRLGNPCRTILEDFYLRDASMEQIREKFGYTNTDNAKTQKYKCLQRLKKLFSTSYKEEA
jgi:RNA polymerase sigma factor (sigma-70 family)